jgi:hypothetical protein
LHVPLAPPLILALLCCIVQRGLRLKTGGLGEMARPPQPSLP